MKYHVESFKPCECGEPGCLDPNEEFVSRHVFADVQRAASVAAEQLQAGRFVQLYPEVSA